MKKNKINKAFTLLGLVIVISIISILSATAVVTYVGVTKSAKTSNDELLVSQLNKVLKLEESDGVVPNTPSEIFDFLNEYGIEADSLKTSNEDLTLAWNQENNSFALFKKDDVVYGEKDNVSYHYWKFLNEVESSSYSIYLYGENEIDEVDINAGLDTGKNKIKTINYLNYSDAQNDVRIRSNSIDAETDLNIDAPKDTVKHYGYIKDLVVTSIADNSYHEYGRISGNYIIKSGRFVTENGSEIISDNLIIADDSKVTIDTNNCTKWSTPIYTWDENNKFVTASRYDVNHPQIIENETKESYIVDSKNNSCTEDGYVKLKVDFENKVFKSQETNVLIKAHGHDEVVIHSIDPTCLNSGSTEGKRCLICSRITENPEVIPALGHDVEIIKGYEATCLEDGLSDGQICKRCNEILVKQNIIEAHGHEFVTFTKDSSCTEEGYIQKTCEICKYVEKQQIAKKNHEIVVEKGEEITCEHNGTTDKIYCKNCGYIEQDHEVIENKDEHGICKVCQKEYLDIDWIEIELPSKTSKIEDVNALFNKGKYLKLTSDIEFNSTKRMEFKTAKVINLNGHTIKRINAGENTSFYFENCSEEIVFLNGTLASYVSPSIIRAKNSKLKFDNVKLIRNANVIGTCVKAEKNSEVKIINSIITSESGLNKNSLSVNNNSRCIIENSNIYATIKVTDECYFEANDSQFDSDIKVEGKEKVIFNNCINKGDIEIDNSSNKDCAIQIENVENSGDLTIKNSKNVKLNQINVGGKLTVSNCNEYANMFVSDSTVKNMELSNTTNFNINNTLISGDANFAKSSSVISKNITINGTLTVNSSAIIDNNSKFNKVVLKSKGSAFFNKSSINGGITSNNGTLKLNNETIVNSGIEADDSKIEINNSTIFGNTKYKNTSLLLSNSVLNGEFRFENSPISKQKIDISNTRISGYVEINRSEGTFKDSIIMNDIYIKNNSKVKLDNTQVYGSKKTQKYILGFTKDESQYL